jgi:peptidyl-prolyl cis-trans isomerase D
MLSVMRKHAGSWMIKVILFAIVIVFVFWGVGSFRSRQASKVVTINGQVIHVADYQRAYENLLNQYRQQFGSRLNDKMIEMLQIKRQVLNQLIDRTLLLQEAKKLGLHVTDEEVAASITRSPVFQSNGRFDDRRYRAILAQVHLTPEVFEAQQKEDMLSKKLTRIIMGAAKVSEPEVRQWYDWQNTSVNVDYVLFDPARYHNIKPSEKDIAAYFEKHKELYKTDPMVDARYVAFDPAAYKSRVKVAQDEIADYYDSHPDEFKTKKTVEARHILIKVAPNASAAAVKAAKAKAEEIAKKARAGADFAKLAKTYSEGPSKDRGGYLGKFTRSQMVKPFADKAFSMTPGQVSDPVRTRFGWHVIKVESVQKATTKTLEQSKAEIIGILTEKKAKNMAYDKADQLYDSAYDQNDLVKNAQRFGLTVKETGAFTRRGPDTLGSGKAAFAKAAFELHGNDISDIQDIGGRYYIIQVTKHIPAAIPQLEAVKTKVAADLTKKRQTEKAREDADAMAADLQAGKPFKESAGRFGLTVNQTGFFKRNQAIPHIGSDSKFTEAAFSLSSVGSTNSHPVHGSAGFYLLRLAERKAPPADGLKSKADDIRKMLLRQKQRTLLENWIEARKADSRIDIAKAYQE